MHTNLRGFFLTAKDQHEYPQMIMHLQTLLVGITMMTNSQIKSCYDFMKSGYAAQKAKGKKYILIILLILSNKSVSIRVYSR